MEEINQELEKEKYNAIATEVTSNMGAAPAEPPVYALKGRKRIYTNYLNPSQVRENVYGYQVLNRETIVDALNLALRTHFDNAREIRYLMDYYKGVQNIYNRVKDVRPDVDNRVVINYANAFTRDIIGYTFGKPMQYVARRSDVDSGDNSIKDEVRLLNDYAEMNDKATSDEHKATVASICGVAHRGVFPREVEDDDFDTAPYYYIDLDSENTFVAYSSQLSREPVFACTYTKSYGLNDNNYILYTVYTTDEIYMFKAPFAGVTYDSYAVQTIVPDNIIPGYPKRNPLGLIPIIECENNQFRMGHWETAIALLDAVNTVASDSVNDVEQFVNAILVAINAEFTQDQMNNVKANKYAEIRSTQGLNADLKYIQAQLDGSSVEQLRQYLEDSLRAVVGIPDRKTRGGGGGDTGDAVKLRDGWADMEVVARTTEKFNKKSEKAELRVILKILKDLKKLSKTSMINVDIKYPRNKTDNLNSKTTAMSTMLATQIMAPEDVLDIVDITSDNAEVVARGEEYWRKKKEEQLEDQRKQLEMQSSFTRDSEGTQNGGNVNARKSGNSNSSNSNSKGTRNGGTSGD